MGAGVGVTFGAGVGVATVILPPPAGSGVPTAGAAATGAAVVCSSSQAMTEDWTMRSCAQVLRRVPSMIASTTTTKE